MKKEPVETSEERAASQKKELKARQCLNQRVPSSVEDDARRAGGGAKQAAEEDIDGDAFGLGNGL